MKINNHVLKNIGEKNKSIILYKDNQDIKLQVIILYL